MDAGVAGFEDGTRQVTCKFRVYVPVVCTDSIFMLISMVENLPGQVVSGIFAVIAGHCVGELEVIVTFFSSLYSISWFYMNCEARGTLKLVLGLGRFAEATLELSP